MKQHQPQHTMGPKLTKIAALLASSAFAAWVSTPVYAQAQPAAKPAAEADAGNLNRVVITATSQPKSKMRSSVSVTDVDQDAVKDFGAHTEAEVGAALGALAQPLLG